MNLVEKEGSRRSATPFQLRFKEVEQLASPEKMRIGLVFKVKIDDLRLRRFGHNFVANLLQQDRLAATAYACYDLDDVRTNERAYEFQVMCTTNHDDYPPFTAILYHGYSRYAIRILRFRRLRNSL